MGIFEKLKTGLSKTHQGFVEKIDRLLLGKKTIDQDLLDELEGLLFAADLGVKTATQLIEGVQQGLKRGDLQDPERVKDFIKEGILRILKSAEHPLSDRHEHNARALAAWLTGHAQVERVIYPGLESHPQHALAVRQQRGFGGMISFELRGGIAASRRFLKECCVFTLAESLGGVESLIEHPAIMTHASVPADRRRTLGIGDGLIRLSVGIEDLEDLRGDLERAFAVARE